MTDLPSVWFILSRAQHYRLPIWDRLAARNADRYRIEVHAAPAAPVAADSRDYLIAEDFRMDRVAGQIVYRWPGIPEKVRASKPAVVVAGLGPRRVESWKLPSICSAANIPLIGWTKSESVARVPPVLLKRIKRRLYRGYDLMIAYGSCSRDDLVDCGYPRDRVVIAQNTINTDSIFSERERWRSRGQVLRRELGVGDRPVLLCIGRMNPDKRQRDLLEAWDVIGQRHPDMALVMAGDGPTRPELERQAHATDPDRIRFTGALPEGDDYAWIAAADLTVHPGAVGLAMQQSMAFGCPTVIADERSVDTEVLTGEETGWRFERGNIAALSATVDRVLGDTAARERITTAAADRIRDDVNIDNMVESIGRAIDRAFQLRRSRSQAGGTAPA